MTEEEWLACADPHPMLEFLRPSASPRKLRLFAVACCHRISNLLRDERSRAGVEVGERYADGLIRADALDEARENSADASGAAYTTATAAGWPRDEWIANAAAANGVCDHSENWLSDTRLFYTPIWAARAIAGPEVEHVLSDAARPEALAKEQEVQCRLLRDVFGPILFRCVPLDRAIVRWNGDTPLKMAQSIYDARAFDRLPILADALEEVGCDDADVLDHCRHPGEHVRGCWVLDGLLGKE